MLHRVVMPSAVSASDASADADVWMLDDNNDTRTRPPISAAPTPLVLPSDDDITALVEQLKHDTAASATAIVGIASAVDALALHDGLTAAVVARIADTFDVVSERTSAVSTRIAVLSLLVRIAVRAPSPLLCGAINGEALAGNRPPHVWALLSSVLRDDDDAGVLAKCVSVCASLLPSTMSLISRFGDVRGDVLPNVDRCKVAVTERMILHADAAVVTAAHSFILAVIVTHVPSALAEDQRHDAALYVGAVEPFAVDRISDAHPDIDGQVLMAQAKNMMTALLSSIESATAEHFTAVYIDTALRILAFALVRRPRVFEETVVPPLIIVVRTLAEYDTTSNTAMRTSMSKLTSAHRRRLVYALTQSLLAYYRRLADDSPFAESVYDVIVATRRLTRSMQNELEYERRQRETRRKVAQQTAAQTAVTDTRAASIVDTMQTRSELLSLSDPDVTMLVAQFGTLSLDRLIDIVIRSMENVNAVTGTFNGFSADFIDALTHVTTLTTADAVPGSEAVRPTDATAVALSAAAASDAPLTSLLPLPSPLPSLPADIADKHARLAFQRLVSPLTTQTLIKSGRAHTVAAQIAIATQLATALTLTPVTHVVRRNGAVRSSATVDDTPLQKAVALITADVTANTEFAIRLLIGTQRIHADNRVQDDSADVDEEERDHLTAEMEAPVGQYEEETLDEADMNREDKNEEEKEEETLPSPTTISMADNGNDSNDVDNGGAEYRFVLRSVLHAIADTFASCSDDARRTVVVAAIVRLMIGAPLLSSDVWSALSDWSTSAETNVFAMAALETIIRERPNQSVRAVRDILFPIVRSSDIDVVRASALRLCVDTAVSPATTAVALIEQALSAPEANAIADFAMQLIRECADATFFADLPIIDPSSVVVPDEPVYAQIIVPATAVANSSESKDGDGDDTAVVEAQRTAILQKISEANARRREFERLTFRRATAISDRQNAETAAQRRVEERNRRLSVQTQLIAQLISAATNADANHPIAMRLWTQLADAFAGAAEADVRKHIHSLLPTIVSALSDGAAVSAAIFHTLQRAESSAHSSQSQPFILQLMQLIAARTATTSTPHYPAALMEFAWKIFERTADARYIIPILPALTVEQCRRALSSIVALPINHIRIAISRLLQPRLNAASPILPPVIEPSALLIELHIVDQKHADTSRTHTDALSDGEWIKHVIAACQFAMNTHSALYTESALCMALNFTKVMTPLPRLIMRTLIQSVLLRPSISDFAVGVLEFTAHSASLYQKGPLWEGWCKAAQMLISRSLLMIVQRAPLRTVKLIVDEDAADDEAKSDRRPIMILQNAIDRFAMENPHNVRREVHLITQAARARRAAKLQQSNSGGMSRS